MTAVAGAGALKGCGHTLLPACRQERQRVTLPRLLVEIGSQEPAGLIRHERIDACCERLRLSRISNVPSLQMASHNVLGDGHECLVLAVTALDPRLLANAANPFVVACGRVARFTGLRVFPPTWENVIATPKERTKQGELFGIGEDRPTNNDARHLRGRRGAPLQLLERSKNARTLSVELSEAVLEIRDLFIRGIVHRHALSRLHDDAEDRSWRSKIKHHAHALHVRLQRIAGILMLVAVDDGIFSPYCRGNLITNACRSR